MHIRFLLTLVFLIVPLIGMAGTVQIPQTGQTSCYDADGNITACDGTGQDGALQRGAAWPNPRFADNNDGTMTDNLTGLIWLKIADCKERVGGIAKDTGTLTWADALIWSSNLASGFCGLSDGSVPGDWRLPNRNELRSLINREEANNTLWWYNLGFDPQVSLLWSSTSYAPDPAYAWCMYGYSGYLRANRLKSIPLHAWPVRGGKSSTLSVIMAGPGSGSVVSDSGTLLWDGAVGTGSYPKNTTVTLAATSEPGSTFSGWSGAGCIAPPSDPSACMVTLGANTTVTVNFTAEGIYTVTPSAGAGGSIDPASAQFVETNQTASFAVIPDNGFQIENIAGCNGVLTDSTYIIAPVTGDCAISATFSPIQHFLGIAINGSGTVHSEVLGIDTTCNGGCGQNYPEGSVVTLTAEPDAGSIFAGWSGACSGMSGCIVTMDAAKNVTADFYVADQVLLEKTIGTYETIQSAYDNIASGETDTIKVQAGDQVSGDLVFDRDVTIRLEGGYDDTFASVISYTSFYGTLTISGNPVTISNVIIK